MRSLWDRATRWAACHPATMVYLTLPALVVAFVSGVVLAGGGCACR
jgi:hypothetical protein